MPWGRLHDQANSNGKLLALSDAAWRMWGCGLIYCQANLTDGFIPEHAVPTFGVRARNKRVVIDELCLAQVPGKGPCWHPVQGGYQIHDYLDWNDSRATILEGREKGADRLKRFRDRIRQQREEDSAVTKRVSHAVPSGDGTEFVRASTTTTTGLDRDRQDRARSIGERFERFWAVYPRHEARPKAERKFRKLDPDDELLTVMLLALDRHARSDQWRRDQGQFIPHAATWLSERRWEDELDVALTPAKARADWRIECAQVHGGRCTNVHFHQAQLAEAKEPA